LFITVVVAALSIPVGVADSAHDELPGFVDGSGFLELAGRDAGTVEVNLHGALLRALLAWDPELKELVSGLESIHAVILDVERRDSYEKVKDLMHRTERKLLDRGWERLARVRDAETNVTVLVLNDEETVQGLVVMVGGDDEGELVFANIAGVIDLAGIARLGETLEIPGLDQVGE
jgi:hypothetical protein